MRVMAGLALKILMDDLMIVGWDTQLGCNNLQRRSGRIEDRSDSIVGTKSRLYNNTECFPDCLNQLRCELTPNI